MVASALNAERLSRSRWRNARWLVLAPHPDDETLGVGALIAHTVRQNNFAGVVYLTDGAASRSHKNSKSRKRFIAVRKLEASEALRRLAGARFKAPVFLDWPDATPYDAGDKAFVTSVRRVVRLCQLNRVDALAVTAGHEPHCDHAIACELAYAVAGNARRRVTVFEYLVWADNPSAETKAIRTSAMPVYIRRRALMAHRSQLTSLYGHGFQLSLRQVHMPSFDILYTDRSSHAA